MNACSERCGFCGRCEGGPRRRAAKIAALPLTAEDHAWISRAWEAAGIGRDYLGWEDRVYLRQQGKSVDQIIDLGIEMAGSDNRFAARRHA